jgi:C1A family cysteine protease
MPDEPSSVTQKQVELIQAVLDQQKAGWQAGVTPLSGLDPSEVNFHLGYVPGPGEPSLGDREAAGAVNAGGAAVGVGVGIPAAFDWRNVGGNNFITPIRDQASCGSCVAFGTAATLEGTIRVLRNDPNLPIDLSEAHLFYCYAKAQGRNCSNGWWVPPALDSCKTGVVDEACFPYKAGDQDCKLCADWQQRLTKVAAWHQITTVADMKTWLATRGPLATCFSVYNDFFSYKSGVYKHVTGTLAGGHCVCAVGYNDSQQCWICKNSWSTAWGEAGFFRIAYGDSGIDATMWAIDGVEDTAWYNGVKVLGLWAIDQDRNAWAYFSSGGWKKIATDNDPVFYNLLTLLLTAKAGNRPINAYVIKGVITQVYVL